MTEINDVDVQKKKKIKEENIERKVKNHVPISCTWSPVQFSRVVSRDNRPVSGYRYGEH